MPPTKESKDKVKKFKPVVWRGAKTAKIPKPITFARQTSLKKSNFNAGSTYIRRTVYGAKEIMKGLGTARGLRHTRQGIREGLKVLKIERANHPIINEEMAAVASLNNQTKKYKESRGRLMGGYLRYQPRFVFPPDDYRRQFGVAQRGKVATALEL